MVVVPLPRGSAPAGRIASAVCLRLTHIRGLDVWLSLVPAIAACTALLAAPPLGPTPGRQPNAPVIQHEPGCRFQDNFNPGSLLDPSSAGRADITRDLRGDPGPGQAEYPDRLGDSLVVSGPPPAPGTSYLTRLWFRVKREGPWQVHKAAYRTWLGRVADGRTIVGPSGQFTFAWMDSVELGTAVLADRFCSQFHEMDDDFTPPEQGEDNEIIWDNVLTPGTKIEYFVTANYICTPSQNYLLPDTTGGEYSEFEILPSFRNVSEGLYRLPCVLYVDAYNVGDSQDWIERALGHVIDGRALDAPIPDPASWDRYDYLDAASTWCAPMFRNGDVMNPGTSGGFVTQFLGYKFILVHLGDNQTGMRGRDWIGLEQWLVAMDCLLGGQPRQGLWISGDNAATIISGQPEPDGNWTYSYPPFLVRLGAAYDCEAYHDPGCPSNEAENDEDDCVRLSAGTWDCQLDLYGNAPPGFGFDGLTANQTGTVGQKYQKVSNGYTAPDPSAARVINDHSQYVENFRTVIDGYSLDHVITRAGGNPGGPTRSGECAIDTARILAGMACEMAEVIRWTLGQADPGTLAELCTDPCASGSASDPGPHPPSMADRLYQNSPNPSTPSTTIRFSLARPGRVRLVVYDAVGGEIRTLADAAFQAGMHHLVWDGRDGRGRAVPSGIYWSRMRVGDHTSGSKIVVLR